MTSPNNINHQLNNLNNILSIDNVIENGSSLNYTFSPVILNPVNNTYEEGSPLFVNNQDIIIDKFINEYLHEYKNYFNDIKNRYSLNLGHTPASEEYVQQITELFIKNSYRFNSLKGTKTFIEIILNIYAKILGYEVLSIIEERSHNFVYRVSSSIPISFWKNNIRPIVHPMGWRDIYSELLTDTSNPFIFYGDKEPRYWDYKKSYLDLNQGSSVFGNYNNLGMNLLSSEKNDNCLSITEDFNYNDTLLTQYVSGGTLKKRILSNGHPVVEFSIPGVAYKYHWSLTLNNAEVDFEDGTPVEFESSELVEFNFSENNELHYFTIEETTLLSRIDIKPYSPPTVSLTLEFKDGTFYTINSVYS